MTRKRESTIHERVRRVLDPDIIEPVDTGRSRGPLDLMALPDEVQGRLRSTGGRRSDPTWDFTRHVPFTAEGWNVLENVAAWISTDHRMVSAGQVAASSGSTKTSDTRSSMVGARSQSE